MTKQTKYYLVCKKCEHIIPDFGQWFKNMQNCPKCGHKVASVNYNRNISEIKKLIFTDKKPTDLWHYFDFLPLINRKNIITKGEGVIPVEHWEFLERYASEKFNLNIKVHAYRNDLNPATGTFKDVAASVAASVLKEHEIKQYVVASTGNIGSAFSHYLAEAGISLSAFIPQDALMANVAETASYGQRIFRVTGDYSEAKKVAAEFSRKYNILISGGNHDPMRVEGKKTMVFEWLRQMGDLPTVYIQALSGGTGPIAIDKALEDLKEIDIIKTTPRYLLVQPDKCAPMAHAWQKAKKDNFPEGFENEYPIYLSPQTAVPTLATGNPATYPTMAELVKKSGGDIIEFKEEDIIDVARLIAIETNIRIGPASTIAAGGFFQALQNGNIKEGDVILINIGEGVRRATSFMQDMIYTMEEVKSVDECKVPDREKFRKEVWKKFDKYAK